MAPQDATSPDLPATVRADALVEHTGGSAARIKVGSRLAVWGLVGGFGVMTAFTLGAPISLTAAMFVMGAGVLISGLGTLLASVGVLTTQRVRSSLSALS